MKLFAKLSIIGALALGMSLALNSVAKAAEPVKITAAGATFPQPLYESIIGQFHAVRSDITITYGGGGSGAGVKGLTDKTLAWAGSDSPLSAAELQGAGGADNIIQVPSCSGGIVPAYNVPGLSADLNFTGEIIYDMYVGKITKWNDAQIAAINPGVNLPDLAITPAYRSDGSGTNFVWTNYLATQSPEFVSVLGVPAKQIKWPLGQGGTGNPGVAAIVKQTPGAIGYIEQNFADKNGINYGAVKNKAGKFLKASIAGVAAAGGSAAGKLTGHVLKANIWDQAGDDAYPIASFTYLLAYKDLNNVKSKDEAQAVVDFFWYATHDGQKAAPGLFYAPLAPAVQAKVEAALAEFTYQGQPITPTK